MDSLLDEIAWETRAETNRKSSASVASGLRAWHAFAVHVLDYKPEKTLPPACSAHVQRFIVFFRNAGTAANYVSYINWACKLNNLMTAWRDQAITMQLKRPRQKGFTFVRCYSEGESSA